MIQKMDRRVPGTAKGVITMEDNFDEPLPAEVIQAFES
jgi:hypothetical protein